jgi:hypothetical protein
MPLISWLTWIANHIGLGSVKNITGVRKDLVDTKKAKLEINKLEDEAEKRESVITPASFEDVKNYDPKYKQIQDKALVITEEKTITARIVLIGVYALAIVAEVALLVLMFKLSHALETFLELLGK